MDYKKVIIDGEPCLIAKLGKATVTLTFNKNNTKDVLEDIKASLLESYDERKLKEET